MKRLLEQAGYLDVRKGYHGKRPRTWLSLTPKGRSAYDTYTAVLRSITTQWAGGGSMGEASTQDAG